MYEFLSANELECLRSHKYICSGSSVMEKWMQRFWCFVVNYVPLWMAANLVTFAGLLFNIFSTVILIIYSPRATSNVPSWSLFLSAVCLFLYQTLDAIDGKQARRTGTATPLGELFDHGCDAISTVICAIGLIITLKLGSEPVIAFIIVFTAMTVFYIYHWFVYVKNTLMCEKIDVTEAQLILICVYCISGYCGQGFWTDVYFGMSLRIYLFIFITIISGQTALNKISLILQGGVGRNGSTVAETSVISPGIPILSSLFLSYLVVSYYSEFFAENPVFLIMLLSLAPVKQSTDVILRRMTRSPLILFDSCLLTYLILLLFYFFSSPLKMEFLALIVAALFCLWDYLFYIFSVCRQVSSFLGIYILSIKTSLD